MGVASNTPSQAIGAPSTTTMAQAGNGTGTEVMGGLAPPPGTTPDFVNPYSLQPSMISVFVFYLAITAITTLLRMYTKLYITKTPGWGDCTLSYS